MPRKPQVRFFDSRNAFYCQLNGVQHKLGDGPDDSPHGERYLAAVKAYGQLMGSGAIDRAGNENTVATLCNAYLTFVENGKRLATYSVRRRTLKPFVALYGDVRASQLKPFHVDDTITRMRKPRPRPTPGKAKPWGPATVRIFLTSVKAALNWAHEQGLIDRLPLLKSVKIPEQRSRARERIVTPEEHQVILKGLRTTRSQRLKRLIVALENSGARPGELCNATAGDWHDDLGALVYFGDDKRREDEFAHKTSGKNKDRTIRFTGEALAMVRQLVTEAKSKKGLLFPSNVGTYKPRSLSACFTGIQKRTGLRHLVAYAYRHTLATRWLLAGGSVDVLAELLGNTPDTIRKHYSHLCRQHQAVRDQLEEFMQRQGQ